MEISRRKGSKLDDWLSVGEARRKRKANDEEISFRRRRRRRRRRRSRRFSSPRCELNSFRHFVKTCARLSQLASSSPRNII